VKGLLTPVPMQISAREDNERRSLRCFTQKLRRPSSAEVSGRWRDVQLPFLIPCEFERPVLRSLNEEGFSF
jgi:hypothetical protein